MTVETALVACVQGSLMALVVMVVRACLGGRLPYWSYGALWVAVAVRLALPVELPKISLSRAVASGSLVTAQQLPGVAEAVADGVTGAAAVAGAQGSPLPVVWLAGSVACAVVVLLLYLLQSRRLSGALPVGGWDGADGWLVRHRLPGDVRLLQSDAVAAPIARGLLRPTIVLPSGFFEEMPPRVVEAVLEHEFAHLRRRDPLVRALFLLVACLYWLDPIVWVSWRLLCRDQELACDESALRALGDGYRGTYATALLDAASIGMRGSVRASGFASSPLGERVLAIARPVRRLRLTGLAIVLAFGAVAAVGCAPLVSSAATVTVGECTLRLPSYWNGRVEASVTEDAATVYLAGHPELPLVDLVATDSVMLSRTETPGYVLLWSSTGPDGRRYELWGLCYASMSMNGDWRYGAASNPSYPGEELEQEAVDLSTGGAVRADDACLVGEIDPSWFDFYIQEVARMVSF